MVLGGVQRDAPFTMIGATAYFSYLGLVKYPFTPQHLYARVGAAGGGTGAQTAEIGFFSTPSPGGIKAGQTLTKLFVSTTMDDLTTAGKKGNPSAFSTVIVPGTHLWGGIRVSMATTQPQVGHLTGDASLGYVLSTASATAFGSGTTYTGALITINNFTTGIAPVLFWTLD